MPVQLAAVYPPQFVPDTAAAKLTFTTLNPTLNGLLIVPAGCVVLLTSLYVTNLTAGVVTLKLFRGTAATAQFALTGVTAINIPPSTFNSPGFQALSAPIILQAGDSIWGLSGAASGLNITGDGELVIQ